MTLLYDMGNYAGRPRSLFYVTALVAVVSVAFVMSGCAGRNANPVQTFHTYDKDLSCAQIEAEIIGNEEKALHLLKEDEAAHDANVALGVVGGLLFWPALFALDTGDAEMIEMRALKERNNRLINLADTKECGLNVMISPVKEETADELPETPSGPRYRGAGQMR
jgi:hypothetical protein